MPIDQTDPDFIAARDAAVNAVKTETAAKLAELATKASTAETLAANAAAELQAAKDAGTATAAELATLKAKAEAAEAKAATLEAAETARQAAADKAIVDALPEALRPLVAGKTGAELKAAAELLNVHASKPVPGRAQGDGAQGVVTDEMRAYAVKSLGEAAKTASDDTIQAIWKSTTKLRPAAEA